MQLPHFTTRPEFRLALRITSTVLSMLIGVVLIVLFLAFLTDAARQEQMFRFRQDTIVARVGFLENFKKSTNPMIDRPHMDRGFRASALRNILVISPNGQIDTIGPLVNVPLTKDMFEDLPSNVIQERTIAGEEYTLYAFPFGQKAVILYEPSELLKGPETIVFVSIIGSIILFSILLFLVSLRLARRVITPIEERAEKERAYARHIAHELKTPLSIVKSDLELARAMPDEVQDRIDSAMDEVSSMSSLVDDLLLLSIGEAGLMKKPVDIAAITAELIEKNGNGITWDIVKEGAAIVEVDERLLQTLLKNLIANVRVHALPETPVTVRFDAHGFSFENSAGNIPDTVKKQAFDPFVGTPGKGSGIGLSLVKRIAELHEWSVDFEAKKGKVRIFVGF